MKRAMVIIPILGFIGYISPRLLVTLLVIATGTVFTSLLLSESNKSPFHLSVAFHKVCATVHWAFISFYLFSFDHIRTDLFLRPRGILIVTLIVSLVLYTRGSVTTQKVLQNENPGFLMAKEERENVSLAALSLLVAIYYANLLRGA